MTKMTRAGMNDMNEPPIWAAVVAPLLGVPLLVAFLTLVAPQDGPPPEPEAAVHTEGLEGHQAGHDTGIDHLDLDSVLREG